MNIVKYRAIAAAILSVYAAACAFNPRVPKNSYATMAAERSFACGLDDSLMRAEEAFQSWWAYMSLPSFAISGRKVFLSAEMDGSDRKIERGGERTNGLFMSRFGLFAGVTLFSGKKHKGSFMIGPGVASDFVSLHRDAGYVHLIYDHRFTVTKDFSWGLGLLVMYHFDRWQKNPPFNLLPSLRWRITPTTYLRAAWDTIEFSQYVASRIALVGEVRYDYSFFRLDDGITYEHTTVSAGGGVDVHIAGDMFVRIRYRENLYKKEYLEQEKSALVDDVSTAGRALKLMIVYAK
jgi:hypothetical protein